MIGWEWIGKITGRLRSASLARLFFLFFFVDRNRIQILRLEHLPTIKATDVIDAVAAVEKLGPLVLTTLHSEITPILD